MASVRRRRGGAFYVQWFDPSGRRRTLTIGNPRLETAKSLTLKYSALELLKGRSPTERDGELIAWLVSLPLPFRRQLAEVGLISEEMVELHLWAQDAYITALSKWQRDFCFEPRYASNGARKSQFVTYFMQAESGGPIKIGKAFDPDKRHRDLQNGSGDVLKILGVTDVPEGEVHRRFERCRLPTRSSKRKGVRPEWFEPHPDLLEFIAANCNTHK